MPRGWKLIILIFHISIVAFFLGLLYFAYTEYVEVTTLQPTPATSARVYYAAQKIPQGGIIRQEMVATFNIPPQYVAEVEFTIGEEDSLVGRIARYPIDQGVIITSAMIEPAPQTIPTPSLQDVLKEVDKDLQEVLRSNTAYHVPKTMDVEETVTIELLLNPAMSGEQLTTQLVERSNFLTSTVEADPLITEQGGKIDISSAEVNITDRIKAVLQSPKSDAFDIQRLHDNDEQIVSNVDTTKWRWSVTAKAPGEQDLELTIYRLVKYDGNEYWREVEVYKSAISVHVEPSQRLASIDWNWLIGILVTALLIPLFLRWYDGREENT
ncbi:MAG: SAF domain-containing protein [Anaerolineales bacterium]